MALPISPESKFFVPLSLEFNRDYPKAVIETVEEPTPPNTTLVQLKVLAPDSFAKKYPRVARIFFFEWVGPARELTQKEYEQILEQARSRNA